jgi:hypothetical protein
MLQETRIIMEKTTTPSSPKSVTDTDLVEGSNNTRGKRTRGGTYHIIYL